MSPTFRSIVFAACGLLISFGDVAYAQSAGCGASSYEQLQRRLSQARAEASAAGCTGILALFRGQACFGVNEQVRSLEVQVVQAARAARPQTQPVARSIFAPQSQDRLVVPDCIATPRARPRVVCVRLCDGYYFPVNHRISQANLPKDEQKCLGQYPEGAAALYIDRSGGENIASMVSFGGKLKYGDQPFAFAFQKSFNPNCPRPGANLAAAVTAAAAGKSPTADAIPAALPTGTGIHAAVDVRRVGPPFAYYLPESQGDEMQRADAAPVVLPDKVDASVEPIVATRVDERVQ